MQDFCWGFWEKGRHFLFYAERMWKTAAAIYNHERKDLSMKLNRRLGT